MKSTLFYVYVFLITLFKGFGAEGSNKLYILAFAIGCVAIAEKMLQENYKKRELISIVTILIIGVIDLIVGHVTTILFTAVAVCGSKGVRTRRVMKIVFWTRVFAFTCLLAGSCFGIIENKVLLFNRAGIELNRFSFGFSHPNMAQAALTIIVILALYLYGTKFHWWQYLILGLLSYILYTFTYSRTGLLVAWMCILIHVLCRNRIVLKKFAHLSKYSYFIFFFLTIGMGIAYGKSPIISKIDLLLTSRIEFISMLVQHVFPPLFGATKFNEFVFIDNGYIALLYEGGVLAFAWFSYFIQKEYNRCLKNGRFDKCLLMFEFFLYAMTESFFPSVAVNASLLFIGSSIFENEAVVKKHE